MVTIQRSAAGRSGIAYGENSLSLKHSPLRSTATSCGPTTWIFFVFLRVLRGHVYKST
jgi:hypothetical protein